MRGSRFGVGPVSARYQRVGRVPRGLATTARTGARGARPRVVLWNLRWTGGWGDAGCYGVTVASKT